MHGSCNHLGTDTSPLEWSSEYRYASTALSFACYQATEICIKVCRPSFLFLSVPSSFNLHSHLLCLFHWKGINAPRSSSSEDSPNPSTPHCILPLSKAKSLERSLAEANLWSLFVHRKSWDVMKHIRLDAKRRAASPPTSANFTSFIQSLDQIPWCFTVSPLHLANCPLELSTLTFSTLFSALVATLQQSSIIMEQPRKRCVPWNKTWGNSPCCRSWFSGRWQWYHQCSPCSMELSKRPPRSFFLGDESV